MDRIPGAPTRRVEFGVLTPTFSVGWGVTERFRLGASLEFPYTSLSDTGQLSGEVTTATSSKSTLRTLNGGGNVLNLVAVVALQWDVLDWLSLGAVVLSPGLKLLHSGSLTYEALGVQDTSSIHTYFTDPSVDFSSNSPSRRAWASPFTSGRPRSGRSGGAWLAPQPLRQ